MENKKNCLWDTNPEIARLLKDKEDGFKYSYGSKKKVDFVCSECHQTVKQKCIYKVYERGLSCPHCSDGYSYAEKFMSNLLMQLNVDFTPQKIFNWAKNKRYDFYLIDYNIIIETHGRQHKEQGFKIAGSKSLAETQENDRIKRELALLNDIVDYIEIDCYKSELEYMLNSITNSPLSSIFDLTYINWELISFNSSKSKLVEVCKFYNENDMTQKEMSAILKISDSTIRDYLLTGSKLGLCDYKTNSVRNKKASIKHMERKIVQLELNGKLIQEWNSIRLAGLSLGKSSVSSISACCKGKFTSAYGFLWMYQEDYKNISLKDKTTSFGNDKKIKGIVQLTLDGVFIKEYRSMSDAQRETGADVGNIGKCCKGEYGQTKGFKWIYKKDYDELNKIIA